MGNGAEMGYRIDPEASVGDEFRRVALWEFEATLNYLLNPGSAGLAVAVHESRKSCKRLRALFRIVRPSISDRRYRSLNTGVRDAARELSASRDAQALVAMFDDLVTAHGADPEDPTGRFASVRAGLEARGGHGDWEEPNGPPRPLVRARERLELARDVAATTRVGSEGFAALQGGLAATYQRGRRAMARLRREGTAEQSHEWRKAVKYTWHHLQLLEATAPSVLVPAAQRFHQLSDALGDAHNLAVLRETLEASPSAFGGDEAVEPVLAMASLSRAELEQRAIRLGLRLYAERPAAFTRRLQAYWEAERDVGDELPTGELAKVTEGPSLRGPDVVPASTVPEPEMEREPVWDG